MRPAATISLLSRSDTTLILWLIDERYPESTQQKHSKVLGENQIHHVAVINYESFAAKC